MVGFLVENWPAVDMVVVLLGRGMIWLQCLAMS